MGPDVFLVDLSQECKEKKILTTQALSENSVKVSTSQIIHDYCILLIPKVNNALTDVSQITSPLHIKVSNNHKDIVPQLPYRKSYVMKVVLILMIRTSVYKVVKYINIHQNPTGFKGNRREQYWQNHH